MYMLVGDSLLFDDDDLKCCGERINGELYLASYFKASYIDELFLCKLDDLK